jgi:hypothetical protein
MSMRIACIHIPQLALQAALRSRPTLVGKAVVVVAPAPDVGYGGNAPIVVACSRAAHSAGARLGMTAAAVRAQAGDAVTVLVRDREDERSLLAAVADAIAALSTEARDRLERAELGSGPHGALYCGVPVRTRGEAFGRRVRTAMAAVGVRGRVGIADDRFTAWVAAGAVEAAATAPADEVVCVPRGGSAQFLAPRPLSLLAIPAEVQHMLASLGVRTLGQFAALPPPTAARAWDADFQALARGDAGAGLRISAPDDTPVREEMELGAGLGLGGAIAAVAQRATTRLGARPTVPQALVTCVHRDGSAVQVAVEVTPNPQELTERMIAALAGQVGEVAFLRVVIEIDRGRHVDGATPVVLAPSLARGSGPIAAPVAPAAPAGGEVFQLEAPRAVSPMAAIARMPHRRTQRGKQRTRAGVAAQARLFGLGD